MTRKVEKTWAEIAAGCLAAIMALAGAGLVIGGLIALFTFIFMLVWNATVYDIFGGPELSLIQAFLVSVLISFIGSVFSRN